MSSLPPKPDQNNPQDESEEFIKIPLTVLRRTDLSAGGKLAFGRLNRFIGHNESGWPSRSTLAMELGACVRSVANWIGELRELGLLKWKRRPGTSSVYSSKGVQTVHMQTMPTPKANDTHPVGKPCPPGVQTVPTEKKKKRVKEKMSSTAAALAAELYQRHPQPGLPKKAIPEIEKLQAAGVADDDIRTAHQRACRQWVTHKGFIPQLHRWLREDFVPPPSRKPPQTADGPIVCPSCGGPTIYIEQDGNLSIDCPACAKKDEQTA